MCRYAARISSIKKNVTFGRLLQLPGLHIPTTHKYSPPQVDRIWGIWGSYYTVPKAKFDLLNGD